VAEGRRSGFRALRAFARRLVTSVLGRRGDGRVQEELAAHLALLTADYIRAGLSPDEARRQAAVRLGGRDAITEAYRDQQRLRGLEDVWQDARIAMRQSLKAPVFTIAVVGSLILGMGATVTLYALMRAALWRPLAAVVEPDRIVHLVRSDPNNPARSEYSSSYVLFQDLREAAGSTARVVARRGQGRRKFGLEPDSRERVSAEAVTDEFFAVLGITPAAGRLFVAGDDSSGGGARIAVLSHRFWTVRFQQDPSVVGRRVYYDETPFLVVGVAAETFVGVDAEQPVDVWIPVTADPAIRPDWTVNPNYFWLTMLARLGPGATATAAESVLDTRFRAHLEERVLPTVPVRFKGTLEKHHIQVRSAAAGLATTGRQYESQLRVLMCLAFSVLLICCANVANLVRARYEQRRHEFGMRRALGASRGRLLRQLATEGALFTSAGALGALLLSPAAGGWLMRLLPNQELAFDLTPDLWVGGVTAGLAALTALAIFVRPGWRLVSSLQDLSSSRVSHRLPSGKVIVASQFATVMVLLVVAGLALTMLRRLEAVPLGLDTTSVLKIELSFPKNSAAGVSADTFERLRRSLQMSSGVEAVSYAYPMVYDVGGWSMGIVPDGYVPAPGEDTEAGVLAVGPDFFQTLRISLKRGREFATADLDNTSIGVIVNETLAKRYFPDGSALGRALRIPSKPESKPREIIGVVADVRHYGVRAAAWPMVYELGSRPTSRLLVRTREPRSVVPMLTSQVSREGPGQVESVRPLADDVAALIGRERILARLSTIVAAVTLLLAALGLYGLVAFAVTDRRTEFGIRLALGALPSQLRRLVLRDAGAVVGLGVGVGFVLSYTASRLFARFIADAPPMDFSMTLAATACLAFVALIAAWFPAWKAGRTDPTVTLRAE
jgi:predicted permease